MNNKTNSKIADIFLSILALQCNTALAEGAFSLTSGADYSSGKYGQTQSTNITYIPFIAKYETDDTIFKLTVPWVEITGPGDVVGGSTPVVLGTSNRPTSTQSGLGDIVFGATQTVARFGEVNPLILDVTAKIKFSTASVSKSLGTGKNDYTIEADAYKPLNKTVTLFGGIGYKLLGDPTGINLNNVWFGSAGLSCRINPTTSAGFMADIRQATMNTSQPLRETTIFINHKFNTHYKLQSYLTHGYSKASTDWGGGVMLGWIF